MWINNPTLIHHLPLIRQRIPMKSTRKPLSPGKQTLWMLSLATKRPHLTSKTSMTLTTCPHLTSSSLKAGLRCHNFNSKFHFVEGKVMSSPQPKWTWQIAEWNSKKSLTLRADTHQWCPPAIHTLARKLLSQSLTNQDPPQRQRQLRTADTIWQTKNGQILSQRHREMIKIFSLTSCCKSTLTNTKSCQVSREWDKISSISLPST